MSTQKVSIMKVNDWIEKVEAIGQSKWIRWSVWGLYTLLVICLCAVHEPWADEHHVWSMVYHLSFSELWDAMRIEGHFCLWHLCVWPWVRIFGMDYHALYVAGSILMSGAVWLMLFRLNFSFIGKLFIIFSAPFFYYFPVIARCYALIPPILVALAIVYQKQKNPFLYCFLIGLLAHTHAYMEGMVAVLWCLFVYYYVYIPYRNGEIAKAKKNGLASLLTVVLVLLAFIQVIGGIADATEETSVALKNVNPHWQWVMYVYDKHHIQTTTTLQQYIHFVPNVDLPITLSLYIAITILTYKVIHQSARRAECVWIIVAATTWQILFALNIYNMWYQRVYLLFFPLLYILWIAYSNKEKMRRYATWIVFCLWLLNTPAQYDIINDIVGVYSYDVAAYQQIESHIANKPQPIIDCNTTCGYLIKEKTTFLADRSELDTVLNNDFLDISELYVLIPAEIDPCMARNFFVDCVCETMEDASGFTDCGNRSHIVRLYNLRRR